VAGEAERLGREQLTLNSQEEISGLIYHYLPPEEIPPEVMDRIEALIMSAGKVKPTWLRHNLERAHGIVYVTDGDKVIASEALKRPRPEYLAYVIEKTGLDLNGYLERGYVALDPAYRKKNIGTQMTGGLLKRWGHLPSFLTIATDNLPPQAMTAKHGNVQVATYYSTALGKDVGLWLLPEQMPAKVKP
jgi:GNAT superfamily N-acetyltransferase